MNDATSIRRRSDQITLPASILPGDGRFGCGPSKVRPGQIDAIVAGATSLIGTSHRKPPVKHLVGSIRAGLRDLFSLPDGWEIVLGNGGTTVFWDAASFALVDRRSQHLAFGEFSTKFADVCRAAPHLDAADRDRRARRATIPTPSPKPGVDLYALTHNETSTGVAMQLRRPAGGDAGCARRRRRHVGAPAACDGTRPTSTSTTSRRRSASPATAGCGSRPARRLPSSASVGLSGGERWIPASIDLGIALENSRADQTYNTPAVATLIMLDDQLRWMNDNGGLEWCAARSDESAAIMYGWADKTEWASPFVVDPAKRSSGGGDDRPRSRP